MPGPRPFGLLLALLCGLVGATPALADPLRPAAVEEASLIRLQDGRTLRLAGIEAPLLQHEEAAAAARRALADLLAGDALVLRPELPRRDRLGRLVAQAFRHSDGLWLQAFLVRQGLVRVDPFSATSSGLLELLSEEELARREGRGLWSHPAYRLRTASPQDLLPWIGSVQVLEGRIMSAGKGRRDLYLNFGGDWQSDTTARIRRQHVSRFEKAGLTAERLSGAKVRLRGWLQSWNGPFLDLSNPLQVEILEEAPATDASQ